MRYHHRKPRRSKYRSRFEERLALALEKAEVNFSYETMRLPYTVQRVYTPDFILPNGVIVEAKGYWEPSDRTKHIAVREAHPDVDIRFCFLNAYNKLSKKSKTTYADWCDKKGFLWCHKIIPNEWIS
jgi:predicted nuclease of restriction endonuclease-like RecB superfamily